MMSKPSPLAAQLAATTRHAFIPQVYVQVYQSHPLLKQMLHDTQKRHKQDVWRLGLCATPLGRVIYALENLFIPKRYGGDDFASILQRVGWNLVNRPKRPACTPEDRLLIMRTAWRMRRRIEPEIALIAALGGGTSRFPRKKRSK